jgi:hypothetical protein
VWFGLRVEYGKLERRAAGCYGRGKSPPKLTAESRDDYKQLQTTDALCREEGWRSLVTGS